MLRISRTRPFAQSCSRIILSNSRSFLAAARAASPTKGRISGLRPDGGAISLMGPRSLAVYRSSVGIPSNNMHLGAVSYFSSNFGGGGRPPSGGGRWMQMGAGALGAGAVLLGKGKYIIGALKLSKLATLGSMLGSVFVYSQFFGFPYAVGIVGLTLVHESGHALVMYQRGLPFSPMVFVPFFGAMVQMNKSPSDAWEEALVAFGGPVLGSMGAGAVAVAGAMTDSQILYAISDFGFMVNLFNLLPIGSLDGGRIAGALSKWTHVAGLGIGGSLALSGQIVNPIFYLILLSGGWETFQRFYNPHSIPPGYFRITPAQRGMIGAGYVGLIGSLIVAMEMNKQVRKPPEVLQRERALEKSWNMY